MKYEAIIQKMCLEEKAALMTGRDFWSTKDYAAYGIPSAYLSDGPHGVRKQAAASDHLGLNASIPATCFPTAAAMANSWDEALGEALGERLGAEAAAQGVNVLLGPGLNIKRNPLCGRNFEYFSEDPYLSGKMAAAYVRGIQKSGVSACVKHFAANNQEYRRMVLDSVVDERALREIYLTGFEIAVEEGKPGAVMSSYNKVNGEYANENMYLLREILRGAWGYNGVVVTDWAGCNDRVRGVVAGNELEMPRCRYGADDLVSAVREGKIQESLLDECLDRLLDLVFRTKKALDDAPKTFDVEEHHRFAQTCAQESIVLLKNEHDALPLGPKESVCVIGDFAVHPRYQGAGSSVVNPTRLDNFLDCTKGSSLNVIGYAQGFERYGKHKIKLADQAVALAKRADTIVFFAGLDEVSEAEGIDRSDMKLPQNQAQLIDRLSALHKKLVLVLSCGSALELDAADRADAVVYGCLGGQAGARAIVNVLTGAVNPSGKLAESYPYHYEDCPSAAYFPGKALSAEYREGIFVGYRYYRTANVPVRYPFGYGLSYTTFAYSDLVADGEGVTFTLTNTGHMDGAEVAQMYVGLPDSRTYRAAYELKGFRKVFLKAGESARVRIPFDGRTFRYFDTKTAAWETEGGMYRIGVGASSEDIRLTTQVRRQGTAVPEDAHAALPSYYSGKVANVSKEEFSALLGREVPPAEFTFYRRRRMVIHENSTVEDLRYAPGWTGRLFAGVVRLAHVLLRKIGKRTLANTIEMGVTHQPVRGLAKFGGMSRRRMEGLLLMFNGHFFRGAAMCLTHGKTKTASVSGDCRRSS